MINREERLETLAIALEAMTCATPVEGVSKFDMKSWADNAIDENGDICGTACCIAGTAMAIWGEPREKAALFELAQCVGYKVEYENWPFEVQCLDMTIRERALELLGLKSTEEEIFYAFGILNTPDRAAKFLRHMETKVYTSSKDVADDLNALYVTGKIPTNEWER